MLPPQPPDGRDETYSSNHGNNHDQAGSSESAVCFWVELGDIRDDQQEEHGRTADAANDVGCEFGGVRAFHDFTFFGPFPAFMTGPLTGQCAAFRSPLPGGSPT